MKKLFARLHVVLYRLSGGRVGGQMGKTKIGILITTGRKSGQQRSVPLMVFEDGNDAVVVASAGGSDKHPAWYLNLVANPEVTLELGGKKGRRIAGRAMGEKRALLWNTIVSQEPRFLDYQQKTQRQIPVVVLRHPSSDAGS